MERMKRLCKGLCAKVSIYLPARDSSLTDLFCNTFGAFLGVVIGAILNFEFLILNFELKTKDQGARFKDQGKRIKNKGQGYNGNFGLSGGCQGCLVLAVWLMARTFSIREPNENVHPG